MTQPRPADRSPMIRRERPLLGVALVALAVTFFSAQDATTKYLTQTYAPALIVAFRYVVSTVLLALILWPRHRGGLWRTHRTGLVVLRGGSLAVSSLCMGTALRTLPVAETLAIIFLAPVVVVMLARPVLGERVPPSGWVSAILGFAGVLLILRPGAGLDVAGVGWALGAAATATVYFLLTRLLAPTETMQAQAFHTALWGAVILGLNLALVGPGVLPDLWGWLTIGLLGVLATTGHFIFTAAYREAPASLLAPVNYLQLVMAAVFGWLLFGHMPDPLTALGLAIVIGAGIGAGLVAHFRP